MFDERSRRDLAGVAISVLAVALMIAVLSTGGAASAGASTAMKWLLGVGAYVLPVLLLLWGVSFFVRGAEIVEWRTAIGLLMIIVSFISLVGLRAPAGWPPSMAEFSAYGGAIGNTLAAALAGLTNAAIAAVLLAGLGIGGLVVTGLSISGVVEWTRERFQREPDVETRTGRRTRDRSPKTLPLEGGAPEGAPIIEPLPRRRPDQPDPEARRDTAPVAKATPSASSTAAPPRRTEGFELPPLTVLKHTSQTAASHRATENELTQTAALIEETLATFDIPSRVVTWVQGPTVTLFKLEIAKGVKVSRITNLADDLALSLAASQIRILAPIPGESLVGIEVPNVRRTSVTLGDVLTPADQGGPLMLAIGKDVAGEGVLDDLATMPHLLIGGTTGSGKSVAINAMLMSMLMRSTPAECRLILIDPKRVELSLYNGVPHLYVPVVTEPKEAASALAWAVQEMERRLKALQKAGARNIGAYNSLVQKDKAGEGAEEMPYLVIVIDELADLMMVAAKEVEDSICRIAQLARAAGIHLIVATQRPEANVVTGLIKANITNRIAFKVASALDSRVILDQSGAEKLVGLGDMLFSTTSSSKPRRIQGCYVSEPEIEAVVEHLKQQSEPDYHEEILHLKVTSAAGGGLDLDEDDPLLWEAADIVVTSGLGSTSMLQRRLKVGYARAGRIMDMLEAKGVVGPPDGSKPREVMLDVEDLESLKAFERQDRLEEV
ncbi:MAG: DNA translocase FtsK 4TM domain-containing protein [Coriobacteriales bacterium]|nr:DNA translocase FtsK 4TM domain-containing protein [Coriobacteriales bacterium]